MPVMNFDLEDGLPPVSFSINGEGAQRFMNFMAECQAIRDSATQPTDADKRDAALKIARSALVSVVYSNASNKLIQKSDAAINAIDAAIAASAKGVSE